MKPISRGGPQDGAGVVRAIAARALGVRAPDSCTPEPYLTGSNSSRYQNPVSTLSVTLFKPPLEAPSTPLLIAESPLHARLPPCEGVWPAGGHVYTPSRVLPRGGCHQLSCETAPPSYSVSPRRSSGHQLSCETAPPLTPQDGAGAVRAIAARSLAPDSCAPETS
jgi:hypothetical protein